MSAALKNEIVDADSRFRSLHQPAESIHVSVKRGFRSTQRGAIVFEFALDGIDLTVPPGLHPVSMVVAVMAMVVTELLVMVLDLLIPVVAISTCLTLVAFLILARSRLLIAAAILHFRLLITLALFARGLALTLFGAGLFALPLALPLFASRAFVRRELLSGIAFPGLSLLHAAAYFSRVGEWTIAQIRVLWSTHPRALIASRRRSAVEAADRAARRPTDGAAGDARRSGADVVCQEPRDRQNRHGRRRDLPEPSAMRKHDRFLSMTSLMWNRPNLTRPVPT